MPVLPPQAERKPLPRVVHKLNSPVPPVRKTPPPPRPIALDPPKPVEPPKNDPPKIDPPKIDPPKQEPPKIDPPKPQTVVAPVVPSPADSSNMPGLLNRTPAATPSAGPGTGGGVGTGAGSGMGEGRGSGIGPGTGGGAGGGPFQPGSGIEPPQLLREVKPLYTDEARRAALEGNVVLEIVVRRDGSVSNLRVTRKLGAGLDEKALEAVRQWRFAPARRLGAAVDVVVEVSVEFKLR
jgi:protein TonB